MRMARVCLAAGAAAILFCACGETAAAQSSAAAGAGEKSGQQKSELQRSEEPGCAGKSAQECVAQALDAMGGRERLAAVTSVRLKSAGHVELMEQSYRQEPFITAYQHEKTTLDLANGRVLRVTTLTWPEADANQEDLETTLVVGAAGGVHRAKEGDGPCGLAEIADARQDLALGPMRLMLTAASASDLRYAAPEPLRGTKHAVVTFTWNTIPVRVLLNEVNHLPDAVETTQEFADFWFYWGDVRQRIYWDNWKLVKGIEYPTTQVVERNGAQWASNQDLNVELNVSVEDGTFAMNEAMAKRSAGSPGWKRSFHGDKSTALAPGVDLFLGAWNSTIVKQPDGIVILEAPISGVYTQGVIDEAKKRYPGMAIKAVLSTSDSWPHFGGVRAAVADGLPVYILDLNRPLLDRAMQAPHTIDPDALAKSGTKAKWEIVGKKTAVGSGENRVELYPLRGASTERQYMVYFPQQKLLYASDTLAVNEDGSLYDPQLMYEVAQAVKRENLNVETVFAMHQGPMKWADVMALVEKARN